MSWKNQWIGMLGVALASTALSVNLLRPAPKIGYVDTAGMMVQFSEAIKAQKELEKSKEEWQKNIKLIQDSLQAAVTAVKTEYESAPAARKQALRAGMERWNQDLNRYSRTVQEMSEKKDQELMTPVIQKFNAFVQQWGKENGYSMIFGTTSNGNLLQAESACDLTSTMLSALNERYREIPAPTQVSSAAAVKDSALAN